MTDYVLSIDPGLSSGVALLSYDEDTPAELVQAWQFTGGVAALIDWYHDHETLGCTVIAEKFTARSTQGFRPDKIDGLALRIAA